MRSTRREFLKSSFAGASLVATGASLPGFLARTARAAPASPGERVLVILQLSGGNDGLNTVVPYADDAYHRLRPTLRITADRALKLDDRLGLHPELRGLKQLFDDGRLGVLTNVGYPNPDRSHFRSMDIWHTASEKPELSRDGWLGRWADQCGKPGAAPAALNLDDAALPLALKSTRQPTPSIASIDAFRLEHDDAPLRDAIAAPRDPAADDLLFVQRVALASCDTARRVEQVLAGSAAREGYPAYGLARRLSQIARLIQADFGPRVYYTSLGGFDTHARQTLAHGPLLRELGDSLAAFMDDLRRARLDDRVLVMTFSEFGRRLAENASQGTDHGAAAPMFLAGAGSRGGVVGAAPDLSNLIDGDVRHALDFRSVYAAVLERWLQAPASRILGGDFAPADVLRA